MTSLTRAFRQSGAIIDEAVPAFGGLYPFFGGAGTWEILFTRHRLLARSGDEIQLWTSLTGPVPGRKLATFPLAELASVAVSHDRGTS